MLVYGDAPRRETPRAMLARIEAGLARASVLPVGIERHGALVTSFIEAGELLQGVADEAFARRGHDTSSPAQRAVALLVGALARAVHRSWQSGFGALDPSPDPVQNVAAARLPESIVVRRPEGYAFYALYPEAFARAAVLARPAFHDAPVRVVGIRSIGTGLGALVAEVLGAPMPITVRPVGYPFQRELALSPEIERDVRADRDAHFAIVDEGPGLSGSSFGAVADTLEACGVAPERVHVFPGHAGDLGPQASPRHQVRWGGLRRHVVDFDELILRAPEPAHRLEGWVADLTGALRGPLEDISGGAWRQRRYRREAEWPPVHAGQERRKFLAGAGDATWLVKFTGLGREGEAKLGRARMLHAAGFSPEPAGFRHGFLIERWMEGGRSLDTLPLAERGAGLADTVGRYLGFRARHFQTEPEAGAPLARLVEMARYNTARSLGEEFSCRLAGRTSEMPDLEGRVRRVETDNRLHAWEWMALPGQRLVKTDALDHHAGHDLVGCQDIAWDVAGAGVELGLVGSERDIVCTAIERECGHAPDRDLVALYDLCYPAFQLGHYTLAAETLAGWPEEAVRLRAAAGRYADHLQLALGG